MRTITDAWLSLHMPLRPMLWPYLRGWGWGAAGQGAVSSQQAGGADGRVAGGAGGLFGGRGGGSGRPARAWRCLAGRSPVRDVFVGALDLVAAPCGQGWGGGCQGAGRARKSGRGAEASAPHGRSGPRAEGSTQPAPTAAATVAGEGVRQGDDVPACSRAGAAAAVRGGGGAAGERGRRRRENARPRRLCKKLGRRVPRAGGLTRVLVGPQVAVPAGESGAQGGRAGRGEGGASSSGCAKAGLG